MVAVRLPNGMSAAVGEPSEIAGGILTVNANGTAEFLPTLNYSGMFSFSYVISDSEGGTDSAQVLITVTPVNDAPIPVDPSQPLISGETGTVPSDPPLDPENYIPVQMANDGTAVTALNLTRYFGDPDPSDVLTIEIDPSELPPGLEFNPATGVISGAPSSSASQGGEPSAPGTYRVAVSAVDSSGERFTTYLTYEVSNLDPAAADDGIIEIMEDSETIIDLLGNDRSPDGDSLAITHINNIAVTAGEPVVLTSGSVVTVLPDGTIRLEPAENMNGSESFSYQISDGEGGTDSAQVQIDVIAENDRPGLVPLNETGEGGQSVEGENAVNGEEERPAALRPQSHIDGQIIEPVDISTGFVDADGDPLSFTAEGLPPGLSLNPQTGLIEGRLLSNASEGGPYSVTITAVDPTGASISTSFDWTVENLPPVTGPISLPAMTAGQAVHIDVGEATADPDGDSVLQYSALGLPAGLLIDPSTGVISGVPEAPQAQPYRVMITVDDGQGGVTKFELSLQITEEPTLDQSLAALNGAGLSGSGFEGLASQNKDSFGADNYDRDAVSVFDHSSFDSASDELKRYFKERAAAHRDYLGRAFGEAGFKGGMGVSPISGFGQGYLIVEAVSYEHNVNVQLSSTLEAFEGVEIESWQVTLAGGEALPRWAEHMAGADFLQITRPLDQEVIELRIRALLENGETVTTASRIHLETGVVTQLGEAISASQSLRDQLALETRRLDSGSDALLRALAS